MMSLAISNATPNYKLVQFLHTEPMNLTKCKSVSGAQVPLTLVAMLIALSIGPAALQAAEVTVFKSIDDDGTTLFTDTPSGETEQVTPTELTVVPSPVQASSETPLQSRLLEPLSELENESDDNYGDAEGEVEPSDPQPTTVNSVRISNPVENETLINPYGSVLVGITTGPEDGMPEGYTAQVMLNGKTVGSSQGTLVAMPAPVRGTHTLKVVVLDSNGSVQATSQSVTVHVKQSFISRD